MRYFSMFSGIGGFELGIERAYNNKYESQKSEQTIGESRGFGIADKQKLSFCSPDNPPLCIGYSEINKYAIQVYESHFGGTKNYGDATKINPDELPDFDMLCGGFPCQAFSIAGKRGGFEDTRGTLFFEIARIVKVKRPSVVFLENVKGLLNHNKGETFKVIIQTLEGLGYDVQWIVLNSKFFGVPQNRERVFIIGSIRGTPRPEILPFRDTGTELNPERIVHPTLTGAIGRQGCSREFINNIEVIAELNSETWRKRNESVRRVYGTDGISPTIPTSSGGGVMPKITIPVLTPLTQPHHNSLRVREGFRIRRLTPTECARLQGFPDDWCSSAGLSDTQQYKCYGNAVTVNVIQAIAERLL